MYEVYLDGKNLYYPGDKINALTSALLETKLNESGTLNITVPPTNPLYDLFKRRMSEVTVFKDHKEIWNGEVRSEKRNLRNEKMIYSVGELSYLNASSQPQKQYKNMTPLELWPYILAEHNSRVEERKRFEVGMVTVEKVKYDWITNYENTLDFMRKEVCEKTNGYLRIRKENGIRYLDLVRLQDYGKTCLQPIKFGRNLLDYTSDITADEIVTVIRPLGAKLDDSVVEDLDAYTTIESVNGGKDYIENTEAIESGIGKVWQTVHFNVLEDPSALMTAGVNWLQSKQFENMTISVSAIDLSQINVNIQSLEMGDNVRTVAKPFGMDKWNYIMEKKVDLLNPAVKHNISIGEHVKKSYTQQVSAAQGEIEKKIPQQKALLELAKQNASEIIKHATEGNIYFINDEGGVPKELLIMDTPDIKTAKKVWRWNINGLGYSSTGYNGTYGLAFTMDGEIVADFITAGTMSCDRLKGGTIKGQTIEGGTIKGTTFNNGDNTFSVDEKGNVVANSLKSTNATITGGNIEISGLAENTKPIKFKDQLGREIEISPYSVLIQTDARYASISTGRVECGERTGNTYTAKASMNYTGMMLSQYAYDTIVTDSPNMYITSNGLMKRSSSSSVKYKEDIKEDISDELNPRKLYNLPIKMYKYKPGYLAKDDIRAGMDILGFIAEDVAEIYEPATQYIGGKPEMWNPNVMIPAMLKLIQEQNERIIILEEKVGVE